MWIEISLTANKHCIVLGAGKTYTMLGPDDDPGIMVRALNDLFFSMEKSSGDMKYKVTMSYLEVCFWF